MMLSEAERTGCVIEDVRREIDANADIAMREKAEKLFDELKVLQALAALDGHDREYIVSRVHAAMIEVHRGAQG